MWSETPARAGRRAPLADRGTHLAIAALCASLALAATPATSAHAALGNRSGTLEIDPQRSVVHYTLQGSLHETHGTFRIRQGTIDVDVATGDATGLVVVDATSGDSGNAARDSRMKDLVLRTASYPEIQFRPRRVEATLTGDGAFEGTLDGVLTLLGREHDVAVPAHGRVTGSDLVASCRFSIPYVAWGLDDPSVLFLTVAKDVTIEVDAVGRVHWAEAAR